MNVWKFLYVVLYWLLHVSESLAGRWFSYRLLRNDGLSATVNASNADDCIAKCVASTGCSAVSYKAYTNECIKSLCNNLDLIANNGWNTYVILDTYIENRNLPAVQFEWMLTNTCGNKNQGVSGGPKINLHSVTYASSQSVTAGNAAYFTAASSSYAISDTDSRVNSPMGTKSLTIMLWVNWASTKARVAFLQFWSTSDGSGPRYWLWDGTVVLDIRMISTCSSNCNTGPSLSFVTNTWYHFTYSYDGSTGNMKTYINSTLSAVYNVGSPTNTDSWNQVQVGYSPDNPANSYMDGRIYCVKILNQAVGQNEVSALAKSCSVGKLRFSR